MGRSLQVMGLLLMACALIWGSLLGSGSLVLVALANPCVPFQQGVNVISSQKVPYGTTAPANTPTPNPLIQAANVVTPPPGLQVPIALPSGHVAKLPTSIPVFGPSENLQPASPTPMPTPGPTLTPPPAAVVATPSLPPCPTNRHRLFGSGPIVFSGTGAVDVGAHSASTSAEGLTSASQSADQYTAGLQLQASRRTDQTSTTISDSVGEYNGIATIQGLDVAYNTAKYSLNYGLVQGPSDTQLSSGSFDQGLTLGVPRGRSEYDLIIARTSGVNGEEFRVGAIRHSTSYPNGSLLSETFYDAFGEQGGNSRTLDTAYSKFSGISSLRLEVAATNSRDIQTVPDGTRIAYAFTDNLNGTRTSTTIGYSAIPYGYVSLGQLQYGQDQFEFTNRRPLFKGGTLTFNLNDITQNVAGTITKTVSDVLSLNLPLGKTFTSQWLFNDSSNSSQGASQKQLQYGLTLSELLFKSTVQETFNEVSSSGSFGGNSTETLLGLNFSRAAFGGYIALQYQQDKVTGSGELPSSTTGNSLGGTSSTVASATSVAANSNQSDILVSYARNIGAKAQISLSEEKLSSDQFGAGGGLTSELVSTVAITRRISPIVSLRTTYSRTRQTGISAGSTGYFNVDIVGPLSIGSAARYNGRPNPNLPATIQGRVYLVSGASQYGLLGSRGFSNVLVTLDGGLTERTDATGAYQFSFIKPGPHIVSIATGTLPAGTVADTASQSLLIQGGQIASVDFTAGQFAGVGGTVSTSVNGKVEPVAGVLITVDDKYRGYTGVDGVYEVGHLSNGEHKVTIDDSTLPANLSVSGDQTQQVSVSTGRITSLDWKLLGLGSITGQVLEAGNGGFGDLVPAGNVYVVADPGEHASITGPDGTFLIDNLPPGSYTLSLDQDTLPDEQTISKDPMGRSTSPAAARYKECPLNSASRPRPSSWASAATAPKWMPRSIPTTRRRTVRYSWSCTRTSRIRMPLRRKAISSDRSRFITIRSAGPGLRCLRSRPSGTATIPSTSTSPAARAAVRTPCSPLVMRFRL